MKTVLDRIDGPGDLRALGDAELDQLAVDLRQRIKEVVSKNGGHLASNLGVVELTLALHRCFDFASDKLLWDVGHQAYPHKLLTGRQQAFLTNRQRGGMSGFPDPLESPYDVAKVGHSSTAISTGVGIAEARRQRGERQHTVVVVGDGALTGGMSFEGLINAGDGKSPLLVILNDNGSFIDPPVGSLHTYLDRVRSGRIYNKFRERFVQFVKRMGVAQFAENADQALHKLLMPGYIFEDLGFRYFGPIDGHNRKEVERMLDSIKHLRIPVLLHVHTRKGGGWKPSEGDPLTYHSGKNFDTDTGAFAPKAPSRPTYSTVLAEALLELAEVDPDVVAITAAMPSGTGLRTFGQVYPDRMYDVGICEQHSFAFAEGLALGGLKPFLCHYSTFAQRGYDQLFQELVVQRKLGVICTLDRAGLVGEDGETHQGLYDIAWSRTLPGTVLMAPKDGPELRRMLRWAHKHRQGLIEAAADGEAEVAAYLIRYPKEEIPEHTWELDRPERLQLGRAQVLRRDGGREAGGSGLMVWVYGAMCWRVWDALQALGPVGRQITLVNARFAKPFDVDLLAALAADHDRVLTVEDHALMGGFGSVVGEAIADRALDLALHRAGVRDELVPHARREEQLYEQGLDVAGLTARLRELVDVTEAVDDGDKIIRWGGSA